MPVDLTRALLLHLLWLFEAIAQAWCSRATGWCMAMMPGVHCSSLAGATMHAGHSCKSMELEMLTAILPVEDSTYSCTKDCLVTKLQKSLIIQYQFVTRVMNHRRSFTTLHFQNIPTRQVQVEGMMGHTLSTPIGCNWAQVAPIRTDKYSNHACYAGSQSGTGCHPSLS